MGNPDTAGWSAIEIARNAFEVDSNILRGLVTKIRILLETLSRYRFERFRNIASKFTEGFLFGMNNLVDDLGRGRTRKWRLAGNHFVEDHAERKDIRAMIDFFAESLLRTHVLRRSHDLAGSCDRR